MKQTLAIDAGGTKVASALVNARLQISRVRTEPTSQIDFIGQLVALIETYQGFDKIALAVPGFVEGSGFIHKLPNIKGFKPQNLKAYLVRKFQVPVLVINDAQAFSLAEAILGVGKSARTVVGVILGTGIGSGFIRNQKIQYSWNRGHEIGTIMFDKTLTLEKMMQKTGSMAIKLEPIIQVILPVIARFIDPEVIVFGGGRTNYRGMSQLVRRLSPKAKVSKLKNAGILGAALAVLKK